mmetsp:Transcript_96649/g.224079  ORF Transcript_96649/g.224079 Transcript_96649/m.224079 type:complete len:375 (+) Transcript_96649:933-2057(+)
MLELTLQSQRQLRQGCLQAPSLHLCTLLQGLMLQVLEDAVSEVPRHFPLPEVPSEQPTLLHLLSSHVPETCHGARDAGNYGGEGDHGKEEHDDGEGALKHIPRTDLHRSGRELRETPMQRRSVLVRERLFRDLPHLNPVPEVVLHADSAYQEPNAGDHVVQHQDCDQQLGQVDADEGVLTLYPVIEKVDDPLELEQPQQAEDPHGTSSLENLGHLPRLLPILSCRAGDRHEPLWTDDDCVKDEPCDEVVPEDPRVIQHQATFLKVAQEESLHHVASPEQQRDPIHADTKPCVRRIEGLVEGNRDQIVADETQSGDVPTEAEAAVRVDDATCVAALSAQREMLKVPGLHVHLGSLCDVRRCARYGRAPLHAPHEA